MPSTLNRFGLSTNFFNFLHTLDPSPDSLLIFTIQPFLVITAQINWAFENSGPLEMRGVKVGVANYYSFQAAFSIDELDGSRIDESNNVPENIALFRLKEDSALTYAELFACCSRACETLGKLSWGFGFGSDEVDA
jgi:hypothetical protein